MNLHRQKLNIQVRPCGPTQRERGSTILLVLAMLTILLLLGIAFSYSTRLETQASSNYAQLAQARTSAATGLPMATPLLLQAAQGLTTTLQYWNTVPQSLQKMVKANGKTSELSTRDLAMLRQAGVNVSQSKDGKLEEAPQANVQVRDLSGLVNLNAVPTQTAMERIVAAVLPGGDTKQQSNVLMALRGDFLKSATAQAKGTSENIKKDTLDPRDPSAQLLDSLERLKLGENSGRAVFTDQEIEKLATVVTVFSQSPEVYNAPDGSHVPRIPLNEIQPRLVYETLKKAFPDKNERLLLQFAANVTDFSDDDDEPTILDANGDIAAQDDQTENLQQGSSDLGNMTSNVTIGVEMTPFIGEVYPDAATSVGFGDDGQFVEIVNPWNKSVSLAGWTLRTQNGGSVALNATLPAKGYLVVTDNYDTPKPDSPPGHGSLVSLFGATANGSTKQVMPYPALDLPDRNSKVSLYTPEGKLADVFSYGSTGQVDGKASFQRTDPMVRGASTAQATPLSPATGGIANAEMISAATQAWEDGNSTMTKLSQLFVISTGFAEANNGTASISGGTGPVHAGQLAELKAPESSTTSTNSTATGSDPYPNNLDLRLIDVFTATSRETTTTLEDEELADSSNMNGRDALQAFRDKMKRLQERSREASGQDADEQTSDPTVYSYGKLNLNTCSKYGLLGLNLDKIATGGNVAGIIEKFEGHRLTNIQQGKAPYLNVSEFVSQFVPGLSRINLDVLDTVTDQVAVGSSAFEVTATNRLSAKDQAALDSKDNSNGARPATATAKWIISMDEKPYSIISFTLVP